MYVCIVYCMRTHVYTSTKYRPDMPSLGSALREPRGPPPSRRRRRARPAGAVSRDFK